MCVQLLVLYCIKIIKTNDTMSSLAVLGTYVRTLSIRWHIKAAIHVLKKCIWHEQKGNKQLLV